MVDPKVETVGYACEGRTSLPVKNNESPDRELLQANFTV
jgi:hypothetical protein